MRAVCGHHNCRPLWSERHDIRCRCPYEPRRAQQHSCLV